MKTVPAKPKIGKEYRLVAEKRELEYRGKKYPYVHLFYDNGNEEERITTTELDEVNLGQVYNQYRAENGIPFTDEIRELRAFYGLTKGTMSRLLGFGSNQYGLYESGEVPSPSNGKLLKAVMVSPEAFGKLVEDAGEEIDDDVRNQILERISAVETNRRDEWLNGMVFGKSRRDKHNGFTKQSWETVKNVILYFINRMGGAYKTQMNKLLFYTDFLSYRRYGTGVTGLSYLAIQYGPVPRNWERVYSAFDDIHVAQTCLADGNEVERLVSDAEYDEGAFTKEQLDVLNTIYLTFGKMLSSQISQCSHEELAWLENEKTHAPIDYAYGFSLKNV